MFPIEIADCLESEISIHMYIYTYVYIYIFMYIFIYIFDISINFCHNVGPSEVSLQ